MSHMRRYVAPVIQNIYARMTLVLFTVGLFALIIIFTVSKFEIVHVVIEHRHFHNEDAVRDVLVDLEELL